MKNDPDNPDRNAPHEPAANRGKGRTGRSRKGGYALDNQVGFLLRKAHQRHLNIFHAHIGEGLTPQQFAALSKLHELGQCSQNSLGRQTAMDQATINGVVQRLIKRELVQKSRSTEDRRMHSLSLTAEGERVLRRLLPQATEITNLTLAPLSRSDRAVLVRLLRQIS